MKALIIVPTYNERENVAALAQALLSQLTRAELLVVDDNSPDGTAAAAHELAARWPARMHVLTREGKGGRGSAVLAGLAWGLSRSYDFFVEMDADFSHRPEEVASLLAAARTADVVVGSRYLPASRIENWPWARRFFSRLANSYARMFLRIPISDYTNGFRCYSRAAAASLDADAIDATGYVVLSEIAYQLYRRGFKFAEIPTVFINRRRGESNLSGGEIVSAFVAVLRLWWRGRRGVRA